MNGWTTGRKARVWTGIFGALLVLTAVGCGGSDTPAPLPPPPPPPTGPGIGGGFVGGGGCGVPAAAPGVIALSGNLTSVYGGANSVSLTLQPITPGTVSFGYAPMTMVAQGCLMLGDLPNYFLQIYGPSFNPQAFGGQAPAVPLSSQQSGTTVVLGQDGSLDTVMTGPVPEPTLVVGPYGPIGGAGGAPGTTQGSMTAQIYGQAQLGFGSTQGRFNGVIDLYLDGRYFGEYRSH